MSMCVCVCVPHVAQFIRITKRTEGDDEEFRGAQLNRTNRQDYFGKSGDEVCRSVWIPRVTLSSTSVTGTTAGSGH